MWVIHVQPGTNWPTDQCWVGDHWRSLLCVQKSKVYTNNNAHNLKSWSHWVSFSYPNYNIHEWNQSTCHIFNNLCPLNLVEKIEINLVVLLWSDVLLSFVTSYAIACVTACSLLTLWCLQVFRSCDTNRLDNLMRSAGSVLGVELSLGTYARILFVDFSSDFNTINPETIDINSSISLYPLRLSVDHQHPHQENTVGEDGDNNLPHRTDLHQHPPGICSALLTLRMHL